MNRDSEPLPVLSLPKAKAAIVREAVVQMARLQIIDSTTAEKITASISPLAFDWRRLARYSFIGAIACVAISLSAAIADDWLRALLEKIFTAPWSVRSLACAVLSGVLFLLGLKRRRLYPEKSYSNEAIFFAGVLGIAGSITYLGKAIDTGSGHFSLLILLAAFVYCVLGFLLKSKLIWVFGLLSLGSWFGAETGYASGWGAYYLGMSFPLRFVFFGAALTLTSLWLRDRPRAAMFFGTTRVAGLLYLFIALWILSIWGNSESEAAWQRASRWDLFHWAVYFAAASAACIYVGLKRDDAVLRGFGLTFLGLNLYTRFFEFFWDGLHKAVFFAILGASFWFLGARAERLWNLETLKEKLRPSA